MRGLIRSVRGAKGGYQLRVPAEEISAGDIIRLLEGPITFVESIESEPPAQKTTMDSHERCSERCFR